MGPTMFVDVSYSSGVVCSNQNMTALLYYSPVTEGQYYRPELQYSLRSEWVHTPSEALGKSALIFPGSSMSPGGIIFPRSLKQKGWTRKTKSVPLGYDT